MSTVHEPPPVFSAPASPAVASAEAPRSSRYTDASSDHVLLFPTGETHPRGTFFFVDYEVVGLNFGYALSDRLEVELSYFLPAVVDGALKLNLQRSERSRFATIGAVDVIAFNGVAPVYRLGGVGTLCFSPECRTSVSLNAIGLASRSELLPRSYGASVSAGVIIGVSRVVKLLVEPVMLWALADQGGPALRCSGGVRFSGETWGLDLGVIPGSQEFGPYLPWLSFTLRTRGERPAG